jgi:hypothetical protein
MNKTKEWDSLCKENPLTIITEFPPDDPLGLGLSVLRTIAKMRRNPESSLVAQSRTLSAFPKLNSLGMIQGISIGFCISWKS